MSRLYVAEGRTYESLSDAIDNTQWAGDVLVVEQVGHLDNLAERGVIPERVDK